MFIQYTDSHTNLLVFSIPIGLICNCFIALSCLLPLMAAPSTIAASFLKDQLGCSSFCTSVFVGGQLQRISLATVLRCSSSRVSVVCLHSSIAVMVKCIPGFSLSLFVSSLCLGSQTMMNSCSPGLYSILMLYWCICSSILWSLCDRLVTSFLNNATSGLWSVITLASLAKNWWWNFSRPCSMLSASLLCCCSRSMHLSGFCLQMLLATVLCCQCFIPWEPHSIHCLLKTSS